MYLINSSIDYLSPEDSGLISQLKIAEIAGRTCYKSEVNIEENSYMKFISMITDKGHGAILEHCSIYLKIPKNVCEKKYLQLIYNPYVKFYYDNMVYYITTNYRIINQYKIFNILEFWDDKPKIKRYSFRLITDRAVSHELVRHRVMSFAQESQRYCNYSKDKFNNNITFIIPTFIKEDLSNTIDIKNGSKFNPVIDTILSSFEHAEKMYFYLITLGYKPQEARVVLPNNVKTELIITGTKDQWDELIKLRTTNAAYPATKELVFLIKEKLEELERENI